MSHDARSYGNNNTSKQATKKGSRPRKKLSLAEIRQAEQNSNRPLS